MRVSTVTTLLLIGRGQLIKREREREREVREGKMRNRANRANVRRGYENPGGDRDPGRRVPAMYAELVDGTPASRSRGMERNDDVHVPEGPQETAT